MKLTLIVLVVVGCAGWCMATTSKADALITSLPGLDKLPSFDVRVDALQKLKENSLTMCLCLARVDV